MLRGAQSRIHLKKRGYRWGWVILYKNDVYEIDFKEEYKGD